jgi:hypothetical protein
LGRKLFIKARARLDAAAKNSPASSPASGRARSLGPHLPITRERRRIPRRIVDPKAGTGSFQSSRAIGWRSDRAAWSACGKSARGDGFDGVDRRSIDEWIASKSALNAVSA